jgi:DNA/RNA endonuclease G (NUC1)
MDYTTIHPSSKGQAHQVDLHLWRGAPKNLDDSRPVQILVNQGYVVGFCPDRLQPVWSAYRVAYATDDVKYDRPLVYYDDMRLEEEQRIGPKTFGKIGGIQLNVGHMTPNEVINRQFGRLAQMETFLMSNMSPQYGSLNQGVWLKLEDAIRNIKDDPGKDHVWVTIGPIFGQQIEYVSRGRDKKLPIPESYFCITIDPFMYPYNRPSSVHMDCFIIPQDAPRDSSPLDYPATLAEIEDATNLEFFHSWGREFPLASTAAEEVPVSKSRLVEQLENTKEIEIAVHSRLDVSLEKSKSIEEMIETLKKEAATFQGNNPQLTEDELHYLDTLQHTISWLHKAQTLSVPTQEPVEPSNFITYKLEDDNGDKLKRGVRTACNFWNRFVIPKFSIVIRLGLFTQNGNTIARAYEPFEKDNVRYGRVEFNTKYLNQYSDAHIAGTIIHEIGHSLGIGWKEWKDLFDARTGKFKAKVVRQLPELLDMEVERGGGPGTAMAHWDEGLFDKELMTGYKDENEVVMPITIDIMGVLGHDVVERLTSETPLSLLLSEVEGVVFSRQNEVRELNLDYFEETDLLETIPK